MGSLRFDHALTGGVCALGSSGHNDLRLDSTPRLERPARSSVTPTVPTKPAEGRLSLPVLGASQRATTKISFERRPDIVLFVCSRACDEQPLAWRHAAELVTGRTSTTNDSN